MKANVSLQCQCSFNSLFHFPPSFFFRILVLIVFSLFSSLLSHHPKHHILVLIIFNHFSLFFLKVWTFPLIYDYLVKRNMHHTSEVFKYEASLQLDPDAFSSGGITLFISFFYVVYSLWFKLWLLLWVEWYSVHLICHFLVKFLSYFYSYIVLWYKRLLWGVIKLIGRLSW